MEEKIVTAIAVKSLPYKENDKLVWLLTHEGEVISALMKGVKKPKAKLKAGAQPFAFCEYTLISRGGFNTVIGCAIIEDLFIITQDIDNFATASLVLEAAFVAAQSAADKDIFTKLLYTLKDILYSQKSHNQVVGEFFGFLLRHYTLEQNQSPLALIKSFERVYETKLKSLCGITNL